MRTSLAEDAAPGTATVAGTAAPVPAAPESRVSIAAPDTRAAVVATPDLGASVQAVTATASSGGSSLAMEHIEAARRKGVAASDISYAATSAFENAGAYMPPATAGGTAQALDRQQTAMTTASNPFLDWQQTAMTAASNRAASSHFLESLPLTAAAPPVDIPDIDGETRVKFAEAMPSPREAVIAGAEREGRADETPRRNIFHIANMNFNADELRTLLDFVRQMELAVMEPEAVTV